MSDVVVAGLFPLLVAVVGIVGVLITQARADARQERIAGAARAEERDADALDRRREAGAELMATVWEVARVSRDVLIESSTYADLNSDELKELDRAMAKTQMLCDPAGRKAATALQDSLIAFINDPTDDNWQAIGDVEDRFIETINREQSAEHPAP